MQPAPRRVQFTVDKWRLVAHLSEAALGDFVCISTEGHIYYLLQISIILASYPSCCVWPG